MPRILPRSWIKPSSLDGVQLRHWKRSSSCSVTMKTAHGHDAGNSMAGGTGTNNSDILNHNEDILRASIVCRCMPVAPGRAVTMCGTLTDIYYKKLGITIQIGNCGGVYHRFRCNLSTNDPRYRYSVPGIRCIGEESRRHSTANNQLGNAENHNRNHHDQSGRENHNLVPLCSVRNLAATMEDRGGRGGAGQNQAHVGASRSGRHRQPRGSCQRQ